MTDTTMTAVFIDLSAETLEDLHTGSGTGGGDIDALLQRDRRGQPVIRASHLKGLLWEAGEELIRLKLLTEAELQALLGAPGSGRGALRLTSLRVSDEAATLIWGATQRAPEGRAPKPDTLRFIEHVAAGTRFRATLRLADARQQPLLERLLNRVDRLGGERTRGSGLVKLDWQPRSQPAAPAVTIGSGTILRLVLRNLEPLCLPATGYPGNLIRTHSLVRGQTLRGALMAWAIHNGREEQVALFKRIAVGDALPLPKGCEAAAQVIPIPLSILTDKPTGGDPSLPWWAGGGTGAKAYDALGEMPTADEKRKRPGAHEYLCRRTADARWERYTPALQVRLRNATPKQGSGADAQLFSLEEIAEDSRFQAELHCADEQTAQQLLCTFAPLLNGTDWLAVGRGGQPIQIDAVTGAAPPSLAQDLGDDWTLTLVSDAILRGDWLGFMDNLSIDRLCKLVDVKPGDDWTLVTEVVEPETLHGFNAVTGLNRAPALALRRGSCWRIRGLGSAELARALGSLGAMGERISEGCGRFLIGLRPIAHDALGKPPREAPEPKDNHHERLLIQARQLAEQIGHDGPSLSQLQWLRAQALAIEDEDDTRSPTPLDKRLDALLNKIEHAHQERKQGGKAWAHFPHRPLRDALSECQSLGEQRLLINALVQWRVPLAKETRT